MSHLKSKKITWSLFLSVLTLVLTPVLVQAEEFETGRIAANRAAEQRAAIAKRKEERKKEKEAEAAKAAQAQQAKPAEVQADPAAAPAEAPAAK